MERLLALVEATGRRFDRAPHAYLVSSEAAEHRLGLAESLRDSWPGIRLVTDLQGGSFKAQFKRADRSGAAVALVLGEGELAAGEVTVKDLRGDAPQQSVPRDRLAETLRERFEAA